LALWPIRLEGRIRQNHGPIYSFERILERPILISRRVLHLALFFFLLPFPSALAAQTAASSPLDAFAGEYIVPSQPDNAFSFYVQDDKLTVESDRSVPAVLKPISATVFGLPQGDGKVAFSLDASGHATSVSISVYPSVILERKGPPVHHVFHEYVRTEAMIPMRDGVKLHLVILKPSDIATPLPILLERTPYGVEDEDRKSIFAHRPELARDGYIFVGEDIRGRYKSQGKFMMMRPLADHSPGSPRTVPGPWGGHRGHSAIDESTDTYDTVAWLLKNVPGNNGRVGVVGTSYDGFLAMMAGIDPHPAVKAISPQAPMIDVWIGDDFFHNGAFRQSYGYDYVLGMEGDSSLNDVSYGKDKDGQPVDGYDFFLDRGNFAREVKKSGADLLPTWKLFLDHPAYGAVWSSRAVENALNVVVVPTLSVGGYFDQEDMYGPQEEYAKLEPHDMKQENFLVLGPWRHGYWSSPNWSLGNLSYGEPIGTEFRSRIEARFFAHYLKDEPGFTLENTASFQTGSNTWHYYAHFPPKESRPTSLYLAGAGLLSWNSAATAGTASYLSDPADPVPYRQRPIQPTYSEGSQWYNWLAEDQRFLTGRKDVAVFKLPVLTRNMTVTGEVIADIYASTTGSDNDLVVKLVDQYPDDDPDPTMRGYQLITSAEIFRGRYLSGFDNPTALAPGSIHEYKFSLHDVDHVFKAGHTVMVEIQSTWFPLYDRNPQTFVANIMKAKPSDYKPATITIYSGPGHDSALELPVIIP
jgi:putative CocE/NonD family hydrolase